MKIGLVLLLGIFAEDAPVAGPSPATSDMGNQVQNQVDKVGSNASDSFKTQGDQNNKVMGQVAGNQKFASGNGTDPMDNSTNFNANDTTSGDNGTLSTNGNNGTETTSDGKYHIPGGLIVLTSIFVTILQ